MTSPESTAQSDPMVYLYGFVPGDAEEPPKSLGGVGGGSVDLLPVSDFAAVVGRVPQGVYGEAALQGRLEDLDWVAEQGARHERVVTWFVDRTDILPVRLLSLYSSPDVLVSETTAGAERIRTELARLSGLREWDLKVSYDPRELSEHMSEVSDEIAKLDREIESAPPGRRYLLERKRKEASRSGLASAARTLSDSLLDEAVELAADTEVLPLARDDGSLTVVLNAALLVERSREPELKKLLAAREEELAEKGVRVRFSGPWAPYRFVRTENGESSVSNEPDEAGERDVEAR